MHHRHCSGTYPTAHRSLWHQQENHPMIQVLIQTRLPRGNDREGTRANHFLIEASVLMATHLSYSGLPFPSMIPGIVRNWRRTSSTIAHGRFTTARMASEENMKGIIPPTNKEASTGLYRYQYHLMPATPTNAANNASAVNAADAIAKPFTSGGSGITHRIQHVGFSRTSLGSSLISAIPPALSAMGPNASMASCMAVWPSYRRQRLQHRINRHRHKSPRYHQPVQEWVRKCFHTNGQTANYVGGVAGCRLADD